MKNEPLKRSLTFMVLTLLVASPFYIAVIRAGSLGTGFGLILTGWLWSPTLAAILTCKLYGQPLPTDSWRWPSRFHAVLAYLLAPGYVLLAYLPVWLLGLGRFYDAAFAKEQVAVFEADIAKSKRITLEMWKARPLREKIAEKFAALLDSQL